jgi:hypothetical protein
MPAFVRELNATYLTEGGLVGDTLDWDRSRGGDFRSLATALYVIDKYSTDLSNHGTMLQLEKWLTRSGEPTTQFRDNIHNTFNVLMDLAQDKGLKGVFNKPAKMSPIEFIMISVLVAVHKDKLTPTQLSAAIGQMRADARKKHLDIRMNNRVGKTMIEFIKGFKLSSKAKGREGGESAGSLAKAGKKRKRQEQPAVNTDDDVDMDPPASPKHIRPPRNPRVSRKDSAPSAVAVVSNSPTSPPIPDRLAAIRAAKEKLASAPLLLPLPGPAALRCGIDPPLSSTKPKMENNPLESALMARMNSSLSMASNRADRPLDGGDTRPTLRGRSKSRSRSRDKEYERDRERDRERDKEKGIRSRSVSSERSSRSRRPHDGTRDWDNISHRGRDHKHSDGRRDSKGKWEEYR